MSPMYENTDTSAYYNFRYHLLITSYKNVHKLINLYQTCVHVPLLQRILGIECPKCELWWKKSLARGIFVHEYQWGFVKRHCDYSSSPPDLGNPPLPKCSKETRNRRLSSPHKSGSTYSTNHIKNRSGVRGPAPQSPAMNPYICARLGLDALVCRFLTYSLMFRAHP